MKRILIFTFLLLFSAAMSFAQSIKVSGTVKDSEGNPMPGVYVLDKQSKTKESVLLLILRLVSVILP